LPIGLILQTPACGSGSSDRPPGGPKKPSVSRLLWSRSSLASMRLARRRRS